MAFAVANPQRIFKLSMPHSFVKIHVEQPQAKWYFCGIKLWESDYGYTTDTQTRLGACPFGTLTAQSVLLGTDVVGRTLNQIIFGIPEGDADKVEKRLVNRANQMISEPGHKVSANDLHDALGDPLTIGWLVAGFKDFYMYSADGKTLKVVPEALITEPWLLVMKSSDPDGTEKTLIDEAEFPGGVHIPTITPAPFCNIVLPPVGWSHWFKSVYWKPGTGYGGSLGTIRVQRETHVYSIGACAPIV
jgi:hypothetical protein